jgi:hypothetical protein
MPGQLYDWTCSACSTEWVERSLGYARDADVYTSREMVVYAIGYPHNINGTYGLMDGSGAELQRVIKEQTGADSEQGWLGFDDVYSLAQETPGLMSGAAWYHWVAIRGVDSGCIWVANSAPGYKGVDSHVSREQFAALGGFSVIWLA